MTNDQMREVFEATMVRRFGRAEGEFKRDAEGCYVNRSWHDAFIGWQAGVVAGMERAAGICDQNSEQWDTAANGAAAYAAGRCADAIRAEIRGDRNA
ncbi:hypothetical protein N6G05_26595 [Cupriavidus gilardii]|uniref:hypothetical protein n=1 Tax=Cupriavidus gilardii TaxID=82541 RepID=UPI0021BF802A|nr:hypothetical protein [Cupriavidus gilardii]MCT9017124.1 hypothetical protein [Cupriavidus gilardii]MCT9056794.1 hypothetical protein [Cupriavidus gilardii]